MVTIDCEIEQQYHRTVMGAKGSKVQKITTDFNVQIKFPDKAMAVENGDGVPHRSMERSTEDPPTPTSSGSLASPKTAPRLPRPSWSWSPSPLRSPSPSSSTGSSSARKELG